MSVDNLILSRNLRNLKVSSHILIVCTSSHTFTFIKYFTCCINSPFHLYLVQLQRCYLFTLTCSSLLSGEAQCCRDSNPALTPQRQQLQLRLFFLVFVVLILRHQRLRLWLKSLALARRENTNNSGTWAGPGHNTP